MRCEYCNTEYSDSVLPFHERDCEEQQTALAAAQEENEKSLHALRDRGVELGIPYAAQMGEAKLTKAIAEKEAELADLEQGKKLQDLRAQAAELGIEGVEGKDFETLTAEIAEKSKGGE